MMVHGQFESVCVVLGSASLLEGWMMECGKLRAGEEGGVQIAAQTGHHDMRQTRRSKHPDSKRKEVLKLCTL